jgi:hypothetical protein
MNNTAGNNENEWQTSFDWDRTENITTEEVSATKSWSYLTKEQTEETAHFIRVMGMLISHVMVKQQQEAEQEAKIIPLNTINEQLKKVA